ncbi:MAG: 16S rRNA processing protein RimM [Ruminococcaceae bacterium]|nr:16S rRNA processing protein RimM [Oscillospiraceae bacterium]
MECIEVGKIVNTHGVRGEIKLNPAIDYVEELTEVDTFYLKDKSGYIPLYAERVRIHKNCAIIKVRGIDDMSTAETYRGRTLFVEKSEDLPEGEFYIEDIIGLTVSTEDEGVIGTVSDVLRTGAHDVYEVTTPDGRKALIPAVSQFVNDIDMDEKIMYVTLIEGMLE